MRIDLLQLGPKAGAFKRWLGNVVFALVIGSLTYMTHERAKQFASQDALWSANLAADPNCWLAEQNLGEERAKVGDWDGAIRHYQNVLAINSTEPVNLADLGFSLAQLGKHDDAIVYFRDAIKSRPQYAEAYNFLGVSLAALNREQEAIDAFTQALIIWQGYPAARFNLSLALAKVGRKAEALEQARQAIITCEYSADEAGGAVAKRWLHWLETH